MAAILAFIPAEQLTAFLGKVAAQIGVDATTNIFDVPPLTLTRQLPVDISFYGTADLVAYISTTVSAALLPGLQVVALLRLVEHVTGKLPGGVGNPVIIHSDLAYYDSGTSTIRALQPGIVAAEEIEVKCWAMAPLCGDNWFSALCMGLEWPRDLTDASVHAVPIEIGILDESAAQIIVTETPNPFPSGLWYGTSESQIEEVNGVGITLEYMSAKKYSPDGVLEDLIEISGEEFQELMISEIGTDYIAAFGVLSDSSTMWWNIAPGWQDDTICGTDDNGNWVCTSFRQYYMPTTDSTLRPQASEITPIFRHRQVGVRPLLRLPVGF